MQWNIVCIQLLSCVWLFATLWTIAHQAPLLMVFTRQEHSSVLPFPTPGDLPNSGTEPMSLVSPALAGRFFTTSATWEAQDGLLRAKGTLKNWENIENKLMDMGTGRGAGRGEEGEM